MIVTSYISIKFVRQKLTDNRLKNENRTVSFLVQLHPSNLLSKILY